MKAEINITLSYDYDQSYVNFNDNIEKLGNQYVYINFGNIKVPEIRDLIRIKGNNKKKDLLYALEELGGNYDEDLKMDVIIDEIFNCGSDLENLVYTLSMNEIKFEKNYLVYRTVGYSQGDVAEVIIPIKELRRVWGTPKSIKDWDLVDSKHIDNLFWDSPVYLNVSLNLNNTLYEYNSWDMDIPEYWNYPYDVADAKRDVIETIKKEFKNVAALEKIVTFVGDNFPEEVLMPKY